MAKKKNKAHEAWSAALNAGADSRIVLPTLSTRSRLPYGMMAAALTVWGQATDRWLWAVIVAIALEALNAMSYRGKFSFSTYRRAWFVMIFFLWWLGITSWLENQPAEAVRHVLTWAPLTLLPLVVVGIAGAVPGVPITVFPYLFRSKMREFREAGVAFSPPRFSAHLPFVAALLLGASYAWKDEGTRWWFLAISVAILVWAWVDEAGLLRDVKSRAMRVRAVIRLGLACLVAGVIAAGVSESIHRLHQWIEDGGIGGAEAANSASGNRASVRLGDIGRLKMDSTIAWRVKSVQGLAPDRLSDGVFDFISSSVWINKGHRSFEALGGGKVNDAQDSWPLVESVKGEDLTVNAKNSQMWRFEMFGYAQDEFTVLPLPKNPLSASNMPAYEVVRNGYGVVRVNSATNVIRASVVSAPSMNRLLGEMPADDEIDLALARDYTKTFRKLAKDLGLKGLTGQQAVTRVREFFASDFEYSLEERPDDIHAFVTTEKIGHCELFGTATVMLLRSAGVPARYHTGFMISEFDNETGYYNLRGTHAHAWAEAWVDGRWITVDTTPPGWVSSDFGEASAIQKLQDKMQLWMMDFRHWRSNVETKEWAGKVIPWAIVLVIGYTLLRVWFGRRQLFRKIADEAEGNIYGDAASRGGPTVWDELKPEVESRFGEIPRHCPPLRWVTRNEAIPATLGEMLEKVIRRHYRSRFGTIPTADQTPASVSVDEVREALSRDCTAPASRP